MAQQGGILPLADPMHSNNHYGSGAAEPQMAPMPPTNQYHAEDGSVGSTSHSQTPSQHKLDGRDGVGRESDNEKNLDPDGVNVGAASPLEGRSTSSTDEPSAFARLGPVYRHRRHFVRAIIAMLFTGWFIGFLVSRTSMDPWVVPFLLWLAIMIRIITYYVPISYVSRTLHWAWQRTGVVIYNLVPERFRSIAGGALVVAVILVGSFVSEESADNTRANRAISLVGLAIFIFGFWITSRHRRHVNWRTVCNGMLSQYIIGLFVLRTGVGYDIFSWIAARARDLLGFAKADGVGFLVGTAGSESQTFFFNVLPAIVFFISLVQVLNYIGFIGWFVRKIGYFVKWAYAVTGPEAVVVSATPFVGQGEALVLAGKAYIPIMTKAEYHQIMASGFSTLSGSVLVGYLGLGLNPEVLVSSCVMSIPASLALSKLRYPEMDTPLTIDEAEMKAADEDHDKPQNALQAFAQGAILGLRIAGAILTSLLCIISLVGLINGLMTWWGRQITIDGDRLLTLQTIFTYLCYPITFLLGVSREGNDLILVSQLIAEKVITNEYVAFEALATSEVYAGLSTRSRLIATYACAGFGNLGSLGIQIGILSTLAPKRAGDIARLAISALITGVFATLTSASIAGLVITTQASSFASSSG